MKIIFKKVLHYCKKCYKMVKTQRMRVGCEVGGCRYTDKRCHTVYRVFSWSKSIRRL